MSFNVFPLLLEILFKNHSFSHTCFYSVIDITLMDIEPKSDPR